MSTSVINAKGSCLCGGVTIEAAAVSPHAGVCHCSICRLWGGGPFMTIDCKDQVQITGSDKITSYQSSEWAERAFCSACGTHLYYRLKQNNQYVVAAGLFKLDEALTLDHQIFIDEKPSWYSFAQETTNLT